MTLNEYREKIFHRIRSTNTQTDINIIIKDVDDVFKSSNISFFNQRQFWTELYYDLKKIDPIYERQGASSLSVIIALAQEAIANHLSSIPKALVTYDKL